MTGPVLAHSVLVDGLRESALVDGPLESLVCVPVLLPLLAAGVKLAIGGRLRQLQSVISLVTLGISLAVSVVLMIAADAHGPLVTELGGWPSPIGICLVADRLSTLVLVVSSAVTFCVMVYSVVNAYDEQEHDAPMAVFHPAFLVMVAGVADAFLSGDLFNLFVAFELLLSGSYVLLTFGGTESRIRAGATYTLMALASSMLFLIALAITYGATGTLSMAQLAERFATLPEQVKVLVELTLLLAFAIKAAIFPMSAWLPDSYPTAPAPATAVFAGLLTKVGVYSIIRLEALLFPGGPVSTLLMWVALATMLAGVLGAVAQTDMKRMLSFTLVSHIGYMVFGVALSTVAGLAGAVFYVVHHITVQTSLFLVTGMVERRTGTTSVTRLGGLMKASPLIAVLFFIPAMNLSGIPPMSGFLGKLMLVQAGLAVGGWLPVTLVAAGLVTSLLTLYAVAKTWGKAFWRAPRPDRVGRVVESEEHTGEDPTVTTTTLPVALPLSVAALVALGLSFTVLAGPLAALARRAAVELMAREPYITAVLGRQP
ncbi:multicomponent Na+:H+ antiporter subunit D [Nonomuraea thailandensis]|uniref:Multicomponent Na+:H+ antiporter subunit D n=1 Tax=Nonomuraea thailandensis TaxID=1188745 RepID=A0A9X2K2X1_9ACTN|nr:Na+/H+ antiporter subunit D [Nonomuraea thailandensis]MCP2358897.1 multicomponent Na+:H+ antiporter subunit D [Nonomuraea thailandensis]